MICRDNSQSEAFDAERFKSLVAAAIEGALDDLEFDEIERMMESSCEARQLYFELMQVDAAIDWKVRGGHKVQTFARSVALGKCSRAWAAGTMRRAGGKRVAFVAAAVLLVAIGAGAWLRAALWPASVTELAGGPDAAAPAIASLAQLTSDTRWFVENRMQPGGRVRAGETIRVTRGRLRVDFDCGATVTLRAPAVLQAVATMQARAILGVLTAHVAKGAEGFTIDTPRSSVVDLGTDFGIDVSRNGSTDVVVFNGAVDLHYDDMQGLRAKRRLSAGEAARVNDEGTASRIVSIVDSQFPVNVGGSLGGSPRRRRAPVISAVRDNISRSENWNYYEIVCGGMREDAKAFVDRKNHEWNGVDARGIPPYLVGGDYVKTFNDDKWNSEVVIRLTLSRPASIYVLHDDRMPAPDWLVEQFVDTGDKIGMDGGGYGDATIDVGAGVSIDDAFSIWRRDVQSPGAVKLGAINIGTQKNNMYGIVAVPLAAKAGE